ncbi:hypothetical protein NPIL_538521 [Nephila pilipes]|uniref:Reverse transcriptase domain-containing protein n=1 Tax=Nephila pilipes TaxID=299642 RepID=A0A8X6NI69_NEPPI|nr:hypothetical protein NPIL_538521 [Nephila pilipes]
MLRWFRDFLDQRLLNIRYETAQSSFRTLQTGLLQGTVSSCLLFTVYVDDLMPFFIDENIGVHLYANDLVVWASCTRSRGNEISLNNAMSRFHFFWFGKQYDCQQGENKLSDLFIMPPIIITAYILL